MHRYGRRLGLQWSALDKIGLAAGGLACGAVLVASGAWAASGLSYDMDAAYSYTRFHETTDGTSSSKSSSSKSSSSDDADDDDTDDDTSSSSSSSSGGKQYLNVNGADLHGRLLYSFGDPDDEAGLNLQAGLTLKRSRISGDNINGWDGNASLFWRDSKGTVGASIAHGEMDMMWDSLHASSYGLFGEWYFWPEATLRFRAGGVSAVNYGDSMRGGYGGVGAEFYVTPTLGVSAECNYITLGGVNIAEAGGSAEYLLSRYLHLPLSISANYTYQRIQGTHADTFGIRLKYHFGGASSQVEADRSGPVSWTALPPQM